MKGKYYTFFIASSSSGDMRRVRVPFFVLHMLAILAVVGGITVIAGMGSYSRMLWKTTDYNSLRRQQDNLKQQYTQLQSQVKDTNQRLTSLQSLAGEVASAYGIARFKQTPFGLTDPAAQPDTDSDAAFQTSIAEFSYLQKNAAAVAMSSGGMRLLPAAELSALGIAPSLWPCDLVEHVGVDDSRIRVVYLGVDAETFVAVRRRTPRGAEARCPGRPIDSRWRSLGRWETTGRGSGLSTRRGGACAARTDGMRISSSWGSGGSSVFGGTSRAQMGCPIA